MCHPLSHAHDQLTDVVLHQIEAHHAVQERLALRVTQRRAERIRQHRLHQLQMRRAIERTVEVQQRTRTQHAVARQLQFIHRVHVDHLELRRRSVGSAADVHVQVGVLAGLQIQNLIAALELRNLVHCLHISLVVQFAVGFVMRNQLLQILHQVTIPRRDASRRNHQHALLVVVGILLWQLRQCRLRQRRGQRLLLLFRAVVVRVRVRGVGVFVSPSLGHGFRGVQSISPIQRMHVQGRTKRPVLQDHLRRNQEQTSGGSVSRRGGGSLAGSHMCVWTHRSGGLSGRGGQLCVGPGRVCWSSRWVSRRAGQQTAAELSTIDTKDLEGSHTIFASERKSKHGL